MVKKRKNYCSNYEDYLHWETGTITKITELNKEYNYKDINGLENVRFKTVFSLEIPNLTDKRFENCINWDRQLISIGDLVIVKGRYLENGFLVKKLNILRKAAANVAQEETKLLTNSPCGQEFETSPNRCTSSSKLNASPTAAQEETDGNIQNST